MCKVQIKSQNESTIFKFNFPLICFYYNFNFQITLNNSGRHPVLSLVLVGKKKIKKKISCARHHKLQISVVVGNLRPQKLVWGIEITTLSYNQQFDTMLSTSIIAKFWHLICVHLQFASCPMSCVSFTHSTPDLPEHGSHTLLMVGESPNKISAYGETWTRYLP